MKSKQRKRTPRQADDPPYIIKVRAVHDGIRCKVTFIDARIELYSLHTEQLVYLKVMSRTMFCHLLC